MSHLLSRRRLAPVGAYLLLDLLAVGAGMGVPIFAILLGFAAGWLAPAWLARAAAHWRHLLGLCLLTAGLASSFTFLLMVVIWGPALRMLFDPSADLANFGIPLILYEPTASFIGWLVLMIVISPGLQALASSFASAVRLAWRPPALDSEPQRASGA